MDVDAPVRRPAPALTAPDAPQAFALSAELRGHGEDVRCAVAAGTLGVATASRDRTVRLWPHAATESGALFGEPSVFVGHENYVTALAWAPPGALPGLGGCPASKGALISGGRDTTLVVWDLDTTAPLLRLTGHSLQVNAVALTASGDLVSGDLGGEVRVWRHGACVQVLPGGAPVLSLAPLSDGGFALGTGGPLFAIKLFRPTAQGGLYAPAAAFPRAHGDSVRGLAPVPPALLGGGGLLSASHDGSARLWGSEGECLTEFLGHTALLYAVAASDDGALVATGSEDSTARLWRAGGEALQTLPHPGCVWALTWLPSGDLVTACADGVARLWSPHAAKHNPELMAAHAAALAARAFAAAAVPEAGSTDLQSLLPKGVKLEAPSALSQPGSKDGVTKVIQEGDSAVAYSWDAAAGRWEKIGEVVSAPSGGGGGGGGSLGVGGRTLHGVSYDFVFDVDVADGAPPRKLPYNAGQNPYDVADAWLEAEGLPPSYREQVVSFIINSSGGAGAAALGDMPANADPYTGGASYGGATAPKRTLALCPVRAPVLFDSTPAALAACAKKLRELAGTAGTAPLSAEQEATLSALIAALAAPPATPPPPAALSALFTPLLEWPDALLFPVLDLVRGCVLQAAAAEVVVGPALTAALLRAAAAAPNGGPAAVTGLRCVASAHATPGGRAWLEGAGLIFLEAFAPAAACAARPARAAYATALLNSAVAAAARANAAAALVPAAVGAAVALPSDDDDALARVLAALGTLALAGPAAAAAVAELGGAEVAGAVLAKGGAAGAKAPLAAQDVLDILRK